MRGPSKKKSRTGQPRYRPQKGGVSLKGRGVFITCNRGKEGRAVNEAYDLLEQAIELIEEEEDTNNVEELDDNDNKDDQVEDKEEDEEEETEAQMEKELAELRGENSNTKGSGRTQQTSNFKNMNTGTDCLLYLTCPPHIDPVKVCSKLVTQAQSGAVVRSKYILRLFPVWALCYSRDVDEFTKLATHLLVPLFAPDLLTEKGYIDLKAFSDQSASTSASAANKKDESEESEDDGTEKHNQTDSSIPLGPIITYRIEPHTRNHTAPLTREVILRSIDQAISTLTNAANVNKVPRPVPKVDLKNPSHVILVEAHKNQAGISVVEGYDGPGKRWNLQELSASARRANQT